MERNDMTQDRWWKEWNNDPSTSYIYHYRLTILKMPLLCLTSENSPGKVLEKTCAKKDLSFYIKAGCSRRGSMSDTAPTVFSLSLPGLNQGRHLALIFSISLPLSALPLSALR